MHVYLGFIAIILIFGAGFVVGQMWYVKKQVTTDGGTVVISKVLNLNRSLNRSKSVEFEQFWDVWDRISERYVKQPVNETDLFYGALQGLVYGLGDPYSAFFPPKEADDFAKSLSGEFSGIGAEIGVKESQLVVIAPLPGTPAERGGLKAGDKILAIDKLNTLGMDVTTAVGHIRGPSTSTVTLTILRDGWKKPNEFTIHRAVINIPAVLVQYKPGNVAHIRVMQFNENTGADFERALREVERREASGVVLDLRNNPGGYLEAAIEMASQWVPEGQPVVIEKFSGGDENTHRSTGRHRLTNMKTVVLVNGGSASASEIVAGALKDHKLATLIGEKTFGKGSVQDFETFPDGSALKITVAEWLTPGRHTINNTGITPDIEIKEDEEAGVGKDAVLDKALKVLAGETIAVKQ